MHPNFKNISLYIVPDTFYVQKIYSGNSRNLLYYTTEYRKRNHRMGTSVSSLSLCWRHLPAILRTFPGGPKPGHWDLSVISVMKAGPQRGVWRQKWSSVCLVLLVPSLFWSTALEELEHPLWQAWHEIMMPKVSNDNAEGSPPGKRPLWPSCSIRKIKGRSRKIGYLLQT